jgi:DNA-binding transcriptional regulator GbsR (MarR family)
MESSIETIESDIIDTFASASSFLGYSEVHGKILAALLIYRELSLEELAKKTRYSASMISLSLDLLEVLGTIKRIKKPRDRKLYIELNGDMLETIRTALLLKVQKVLTDANASLRLYEEEIGKIKDGDKKKLLKSLKSLKVEALRIAKYIDRLSKVKLPK